MEDYNNQYYQPNQNPNQPPYQQPYQPQYQQPIYQQPYDPTTEVMSIGSYILMFVLSAIPVVNIICWIVWLVSPNTNKNKKNFIWAQIIMVAVAYVAVIVLATTSLGVNYLNDLMIALL
ncbi:hypothetical protein [uncultured Eubacterium sp.]|uniref:hypothetical protein n=1 Tax=uncultured Eubacterium sp. TaxID=165185 RepID=UPI0025F6180A|nr:hypothetical protein [uncultured Eubacterium sp.]